MPVRPGAFVALIVTALLAVLATAGVAAAPGSAKAGDQVTRPRLVASSPPITARSDPEPATPAATAAPATTVRGIASNYPGTAGWIGEATVALPGDLGGRYTGEVSGVVTVCVDRCATLPIVDWCQCYWGTTDERIVDLSHAAWALVSDAPLAEGLVTATVILDG